MITLYDFPLGARGLRVAWLCEEMGLPHTFVPVLFLPDAAYRSLNPLGTVPFLQDGDVAMSESVANVHVHPLPRRGCKSSCDRLKRNARSKT